ncbi:hypothetical protein L3073_10910 [Ancylomarina sp. DW003]|nr:hypothetical protein [Ancylomarina sp. DW003]MDE5422717.1 hypothetical protein [Ancylomarina sp. DW003]
MKNIKYILYSLLAVFFLFTACDETEDFQYDLHETTAADIDSIILKTNHIMLLLDGVSELELDLSLIQFGIQIDSKGDTIEVEHDLVKTNLPDGAIKYYYQYVGQEPVEFDTENYVGDVDTNEEKVYLFARVFGQETAKHEVLLKKFEIDEALRTEKTIPVIFHIFEPASLLPTDFTFTEEHIQDKLDQANLAFQRLTNTSPNGFDTKIKFVAAKYDNKGAPLAVPGMNIIQMSTDTAEEEHADMFNLPMGGNGLYPKVNMTPYITEKGAMWDHTKFFNVWVIAVKQSYAYDQYNFMPRHILTGHNDGTLAGVYPALTEVDEGAPIEYGALDIGGFIPRKDFINQEFAQIAGEWLGLLDNYRIGPFPPSSDLDYCDDTFTFNWTLYKNKLYKVDVVSGFEYKSTNIMDLESLCTTLTYEQGKRVLHAINYCPTRMCWKSVED